MCRTCVAFCRDSMCPAKYAEAFSRAFQSFRMHIGLGVQTMDNTRKIQHCMNACSGVARCLMIVCTV